MQRIHFNFFNVLVKVESDWTEILSLLKMDFSCFFISESPLEGKVFFTLKLYNEKKSLIDQLPPIEVQASMQTQNSLTYEQSCLRYNDYYGELFSVINFKLETASLFSLNLEKMHEIAYLILLSRVGKKLDLMGFHKLHAFAISYGNQALVCMMPSKGGKSTLLMELLKDPLIKIISDDIPLINRKGLIIPFPIKIGLDAMPVDFLENNPGINIYEMNRAQYGIKKIISLKDLSNQVESLNKKFSNIILVEAFRYNSKSSILKKSPWFQSMKGLMKHGVIGIGLPMVIEYFWEYGAIDFFKKAFIFFSRLFSFFRLSIRARKFKLLLGNNSQRAAAEIILLLKSNFEV